MKISIRNASPQELAAIRPSPHRKPKRVWWLFRTLVRLLSASELRACRFSFETEGMERLGKREPCLILMNHSCFLDPKIASRMLYPRPFHIVCTTDAFVGKDWLMRRIGCIPTQKFVMDLGLVRDMRYALHTLNSSVLLYPEAGYSLDGTDTALPDSLGGLLKLLKVPVVMIQTEGAFSRDPLYNNLQKRKVKVSARMTYLLSPDEIERKSAEELNGFLRERFSYDAFAWQKEHGVRIDEPFRADGLERVLYRCTDCGGEGCTEGKGTRLLCHRCGKEYELTETGELRAIEGVTEFFSVPDWFAWERRCVAEELRRGTYRLDTEVEIYAIADTKRMYRLGEGRLVHTSEGLRLTGCDGAVELFQKPLASHSLSVDFYFYEIGDMIAVGNLNVMYYCFPKDQTLPVAKARLAAEELYHMQMQNRSQRKRSLPSEKH